MDDLEAVRTISEILEKFDDKEVQERIVRWSLEKCGLRLVEASSAPGDSSGLGDAGGRAPGATDIRTFVTSKAPASDNQFAAAVAYFYAFEAPPQDRRGTISASDLMDACRMVGRPRLGDPAKTLSNAKNMGYLDKVGPGAYKLNTVGENLVAMTLPSGASDAPSRARRMSPARPSTRTKVKKGGKRR